MAQPNEESEVIGHYLVPAHGRPAQPLLHESTSLFQDVVSDKLANVEAAVEADVGKINQFFLILHWASDAKSGTGPGPDLGADSMDVTGASSKASVMVKQRTLLMIAAHAGSLRVLAYLLARGAEPSRKSPDGHTAYDLAVAGEASQAATALAMMRDADSHPSSSTRSSSTTETHSFNGTEAVRTSGRQDLADSDNSSYSTTDLTRPEYSTDEFRMFNFKVLRCSKRHAHDWRACPFAHPTENARRRDPREFKYCALACPDYKQGFCIRGDVCPYAHGVFECWLHPSRYRTQLCKDGANCHRPVCFFAHSLPELRAPTYTWVPGPADLTRAAVPASNGGAMPVPAIAVNGADGASGNGGSPVTGVRADPRGLLSHTSSGLPGNGTSSDGTSSGAPASCGSPRTVGGGSSGVMALMMGGGAGRGGLSGALLNGRNGTTGSSSCSSGGNGSPSPSCSVGSKDGCNGGGTMLAQAMAVAKEGKSNQAQAQGTSPGSGGKGNPNLTQPNAAASMLGFTAPRMSNAFARRHGLNPKDNPMLNLQKIALQSQQQQQQAATQGGSLGMGNHAGAYAQDNGNGAAVLRGHPTAVSSITHSLQTSSGGAGGRNGGSYQNGTAGPGGPRLHAAAAAAAVAAATPSAYSTVPFGPPAGAFGVAPMPVHVHGAHLGATHADPSLLAAQLAALNIHQQHAQHQRQQQHLGMGIGISGINMASGAAAAAAAAAVSSMGAAGMGHGAVQYMTSAGPHHALMHPGMYGAGANGGMYDHPQQHLMAAMTGAQTEV